jgi:hypothetical protein
LGTTVTEIKVPAVFRYHILLKDEWRLDTHGNVVLVHAPRIHPTLPVAFDSSRMERRAERGWARLDTGKEMAELEKTVTEHLSKVAHTKVDLVRDKARETVAEFVKAWLVRNDHWCKDRFGVIKVVFANERERPFEELPATVSLE